MDHEVATVLTQRGAAFSYRSPASTPSGDVVAFEISSADPNLRLPRMVQPMASYIVAAALQACSITADSVAGYDVNYAMAPAWWASAGVPELAMLQRRVQEERDNWNRDDSVLILPHGSPLPAAVIVLSADLVTFAATHPMLEAMSEPNAASAASAPTDSPLAAEDPKPTKKATSQPRKCKEGCHRSRIEHDVAAAMKNFEVEFEYLAPTSLTSGHVPAFTILQADPDLQLPRWVDTLPYARVGEVLKAFGTTHRSLDDQDSRSLTFSTTPDWWRANGFEEFAERQALVDEAAARQLDWTLLATAYMNSEVDRTAIRVLPGTTVASRHVHAVSSTFYRFEEKSAAFEAKMAEWDKQHALDHQANLHAVRQLFEPIVIAGRERATSYPQDCMACWDRVREGRGLYAKSPDGDGWQVACRKCLAEAMPDRPIDWKRARQD